MKRILFLLLAVCATMSCVTDPTTDMVVGLDSSEKLYVSFDDESRIELNESMKTVWTEGDQVSVFYMSNANDCFKFDGKTGDRSGTLSRVQKGTSTQESDKITILYPYNAQHKLLNSGEVLAKLPATQNYQHESFGVGSGLMVAESDNAQFALKNVCGWLKFQFTGVGAIKSITLEGNKGEQIAGDIYVNSANASSRLLYSPSSEYGDNEVGGSLIVDDNIIKKVTLDCGRGVNLNNSTATSFYIAVPPQTFEDGVKVTIEATDGTVVEKSTSNAVVVERNNIQPMASINLQLLYADGDVQVLSTNYEGADVAITFPSALQAKGHRIKWGVTNLPHLAYYGNQPIPEMLHSHDAVYPARLISRDTTLNINHYNAYRRNANGDIGYYITYDDVEEVSADDPRIATGEAEKIQYYYQFTPGEPLVLMMSEVAYTDCTELDDLYGAAYTNHMSTCNKKHPTTNYGFGQGWYWFPYDMEAYKKAVGEDSNGMGVGGSTTSTVDPNDYWHEDAWYKKIEFRLPAPAQFDGSVDIALSNLTSDSATVTFEPTDKTFCYFFYILEDQDDHGWGYNDIVKTYFNGDESLWQWFVTSEMGKSSFGINRALASEGALQLNLEEYFVSLTANMKYHIVVTAVGSKMVDGKEVADLSAQNYQHIEFTLPNYTLPEPELVVTAVEPYSPWKVKFNVKNPDYATNPVKKVVYVASYTREFDNYIKNNGYTYGDILLMNASISAYQLSDADLEKVNSEVGFDMEFDVLENSAFTAAFMAWNMEGRPSNPDKEGAQAVAEAKSASVSTVPQFDMTKLNTLKGEWTATATVNVYDGSYNPTTKQRSWKVSIGDLSTNETLSAADYEILAAHGVTTEAADAYLAEYNRQAVQYNQGVTGQNRVLCLGWQIDDTRAMSLATPWDLFMMTDYKASLVDYLYHDFGPKWFLQTDAQGNIFVPVNCYRVQPLSAWYSGANHYLCGGNYEEGIAKYYDAENTESVESVALPVQISTDGNTITIKSYNVTTSNNQTVTLYPNIVYDYLDSGLPAFYNTYIESDVVLTRGWNNTTATTLSMDLSATRSSAKNNDAKEVKVINDANYVVPSKVYSRTVFTSQSKAKTIILKQPSRKEIEEKLKQLNQISVK